MGKEKHESEFDGKEPDEETSLLECKGLLPGRKDGNGAQSEG